MHYEMILRVVSLSHPGRHKNLSICRSSGFFCFFFLVTRSQVQNPVMKVTTHRMQTKTYFIFKINQSIYLINQQLHTFIFNSFLFYFFVGYFLKELSL